MQDKSTHTQHSRLAKGKFACTSVLGSCVYAWLVISVSVFVYEDEREATQKLGDEDTVVVDERGQEEHEGLRYHWGKKSLSFF